MTTLQRRRSSRPSTTGSRNNGGGDGGGENDAYTNSLPSSSNSNQRRSSNNNNNNSAAASSPNPIVSAWEARRRRKSGSANKQTSDNYEEEEDDDDDEDPNNNGNNRSSRRRRNNKNGKKKTKKSSRGKDLPDEEYDPYDSDPGESYREHCERIQGESSKTCLAMPKFLKDGKLGSSSKRSNGMSQVGNDSSSSISNGNGIKTMVMNNGIDQNHLNRSHHNHDDKSGSTHPPSPFQSELDDMSPIQQRRRRSSSQQQQGGGRRGGGGGGLNPNNPLGHQQQFGTPQQSHQHSQPNAPASLPRDLARVRYSLRTAIGDGTDVQPGGSAAMMERRDLRPNNIHINVSHWSDFGGRNYMEDRYAIEDMGAVQVEVSPAALKSSQTNNQNNDAGGAGVEVTFGKEQEKQQQRKNRRLKMPLTWLGIFDGHGGDKASQYCSDWLSSYVRNEESYPFDLGYAMKNAFTSIDDDFVATGQPDGSTCCAATLVGGRRIVCANAGDSRAIVVRRDGTVVRLSRDHKPGMPDETRRISELGGRVIYWGRWRVEGLLAVSRSVGDASLKPYVTAEPEVCEYDIGKDDWFLVLSSDGVWDVMDNEEAAHVVIASSCVMEDGRLKIDTNRFKWAARNLCDHAKSCGSTDNFSCVVVDLKSCGNPQAKSGRYSP